MFVDLIFANAAIQTGDPTRPRLEPGYLAVTDGHIAAIGPGDVPPEYTAPPGGIVDLHRQGLLIPGFHDAHIHALEGGLKMIQCNLHDCRTEDEYIQKIRDYAHGRAGTREDHPWIIGAGWTMGTFTSGQWPDKTILDAKLRNERPICLDARDGHATWVNSAALTLIEQHFKNASWWDDKDPDWENWQKGMFFEGPAGLVSSLAKELSPPSEKDWQDGLEEAQKQLHRWGITGWQDALVSDTVHHQYLKAAQERRLHGRVTAALPLSLDTNWSDELETKCGDKLRKFSKMRHEADPFHGTYRVESIKIFLDGIIESRKSALSMPYLGDDHHPKEWAGPTFIPLELLRDLARKIALDDNDFAMHFHAIGDRAVHDALEAIRVAREAGSNGRHQIAHLGIVSPHDIAHFSSLNAIANIQPLWASHGKQMDDYTIPILPRRLHPWQYPFGSLKKAGARFAGGSDWSVTSANPLEEMHVAVHRTEPYTDPEVNPFYPEQRIDLDTAFAAYTSGSAYAGGWEGEAGMLREGNFADLVLLDRDIFEPNARLDRVQVLETYVDGNLVYAQASAGSPTAAASRRVAAPDGERVPTRVPQW
ncbi:amidohydrolase [Amycolatopsis cynarae]|uniref:Amidohydrolase n=1 Tax=Amycolatopsis cynarae TaxID=2995223 RepID=A0ABY7B767_9PSEU|nr:amidohydrolase [Amycolatopsis sp. HUAS 11-8]WAL67805.1 amidohydrolase [Amycolatopsis sp. HUAS 11-8]